MSTRRPFMSLNAAFLATVFVVGLVWAGFLGEQNRVTTRVPVLVADLPAYAQIDADDTVVQAVPKRDLDAEVIRNAAELEGRYTRVPVARGASIRASDLVPRALGPSGFGADEAVAIGIPATAAMTLGGSLAAGEVVEIAIGQEPAEGGVGEPPLRVEQALVLAVTLAGEQSAAAQQKSADAVARPYVIVLAVPADRVADLADAQSNLLIMRSD